MLLPTAGQDLFHPFQVLGMVRIPEFPFLPDGYVRYLPGIFLCQGAAPFLPGQGGKGGVVFPGKIDGGSGGVPKGQPPDSVSLRPFNDDGHI